MRACLPRQFTVHSVKTLDRIRYAIGHFEMVAESQINHESRGCKLQTNGVSNQREAPEQKEILTLIAASKASLHEPPVNFNFAHSLKRSGRDGECRVVSTLISGVERYRSKKTVAKSRMHSRGI